MHHCSITYSLFDKCITIRRVFHHFNKDKVTDETVYAITSLSPQQANQERLLQLNRNHWSIENSLHYVRDVTFKEDHSQIRTGNAPRIVATLYNFVISIFRLIKIKNIAKALRERAAKPHLSLSLLGI